MVMQYDTNSIKYLHRFFFLLKHFTILYISADRLLDGHITLDSFDNFLFPWCSSQRLSGRTGFVVYTRGTKHVYK